MEKYLQFQTVPRLLMSRSVSHMLYVETRENARSFNSAKIKNVHNCTATILSSLVFFIWEQVRSFASVKIKNVQNCTATILSSLVFVVWEQVRSFASLKYKIVPPLFYLRSSSSFGILVEDVID